MNLNRIFAIIAVTFALHTTHAFGQAAWSYVELLHSSSSATRGDRWDGDSLVNEGCDEASSEDQDCLTVTLPKVLVAGKEIVVTLTGNRPTERNAPWTLKAPQGEAYCVRDVGNQSCFISFKDLGVTDADIEQYVAATVPEERNRMNARVRIKNFLRAPVLRYWHGIH